MISQIIDVNSDIPRSGDNYFFDCNVWILLFAGVGNYDLKKQQAYSSLLGKIQTAKAAIFINSLVISEFCNTCLRIEFAKWVKQQSLHQKYDYKKDYVGSASYCSTVQWVISLLSKIRKITHFCTDNLNRFQFDDLHVNFGYCDFNDSYYLKIAELDNYKIVTDDADFQHPDIAASVRVITANHRI